MVKRSNKHFEHARKIISGWPRWKQQVGWAPKSNVQGWPNAASMKTELRKEE